jgi:hypothetical protein
MAGILVFSTSINFGYLFRPSNNYKPTEDTHFSSNAQNPLFHQNTQKSIPKNRYLLKKCSKIDKKKIFLMLV